MQPIGLIELQTKAEAYQARYNRNSKREDEFRKKYGAFDQPGEYQIVSKRLKKINRFKKTREDRELEEYLWFLNAKTTREVSHGNNDVANNIDKIDLSKYLKKDFYRENSKQSSQKLKKSITIGATGAVATTLITGLFNDQSLVNTIAEYKALLIGSGFYFAGIARAWEHKKEKEKEIGFGFQYDIFSIALSTGFNRIFGKSTIGVAGLVGWIMGFYAPQQTADRVEIPASGPFDVINIYDSLTAPITAAAGAGTTAALALMTAPFTVLPIAHGTIGLTKDFWVAGLGKALNRSNFAIKDSKPINQPHPPEPKQ